MVWDHWECMRRLRLIDEGAEYKMAGVGRNCWGPRLTLSDALACTLPTLMNSHPDATLIREEMGLRGFNKRVKQILHGGGDNVFDYVQAVLAGRYYNEDEHEEKRIFIDGLYGLTQPTACAYEDIPDEDEYHISRDYDSILGHSESLPYKVPIGIYPVPPHNETLSKNVHITVPCRMGMVSACQSECMRKC